MKEVYLSALLQMDRGRIDSWLFEVNFCRHVFSGLKTFFWQEGDPATSQSLFR